MALEDRIWELERELAKVNRALGVLLGSALVGKKVKVWPPYTFGVDGVVDRVGDGGLWVKTAEPDIGECWFTASDVVEGLQPE